MAGRKRAWICWFRTVLVVAAPAERSTEVSRPTSWVSDERLSRRTFALGSKYPAQVVPLVKLSPGYPVPIPMMLAIFPVSERESPKK